MQSERMGELFVRHGLITSDQLYNALEKQRQLGGNKHLGDMLVSMGRSPSETVSGFWASIGASTLSI